MPRPVGRGELSELSGLKCVWWDLMRVSLPVVTASSCSAYIITQLHTQGNCSPLPGVQMADKMRPMNAEPVWETHPVTPDRFEDFADVINKNRRQTH